jgi:hypothetical protein
MAELNLTDISNTTLHLQMFGATHRNDVFRDKVGDIIIDTVEPLDTYVWETGININGDEEEWVVVEQYNNKKEANIGHIKWVEKIKTNPNTKLKEIFTGIKLF